MKLFIRWIVTVISLYVAAWILPGIYATGSSGIVAFTVMAIVLGLVNVFVKPLLKFLSCGLIAATLGLFLVIINAFVLLLASWICQWLGIGFVVDGFISALLGSIIVSAVSFLLNMFVSDDKK